MAVKYAKAFLITAATTYPFIFVTNEIAGLSPQKYQACSDKPCLFQKMFSSEYLPSTYDTFHSPFRTVQNGDLHVHEDEDHEAHGNWTSPVCRNMSREAMQQKCEEKSIRKGVGKTWYSKPLIEWSYRVCLFSFFFLKVLHDWCLMYGMSERCTLNIGFLSVFFQLTCMPLVLLWTQTATGVFMTYVVPGECACYYRLPMQEMALAILTPVIFCKLAADKLASVHRAVLFGDYLYFVSYDVAYHLVKNSVGDPTLSYLVGTTHGSREISPASNEETGRPRTPQEMRPFMYKLWALQGYAYVTGVFVGIPIGSMWVRGLYLATHFAKISVGVIFVLVCGAIYVTWLQVKRFWSVKHGKIKERFWELGFGSRFWAVFGSVVLLLVRLGATVQTCMPIVSTLLGKEVRHKEKTAFRWFVSGILYFYSTIILYIVLDVIRPLVMALHIKARYPKEPLYYIEGMENHPEFNLEEEGELAQRFLEENPLSRGSQLRLSVDHLDEIFDDDAIEDWNQKWAKTLDWSGYWISRDEEKAAE